MDFFPPTIIQLDSIQVFKKPVPPTPPPTPVVSLWNAADKSAGITLTNGNTTATSSGASYQGLRGVTGRSTGKYYFEITIGANLPLSLGIGPSTWNFTSGNYIGFDGSGCGMSKDGAVNYNSGSAGAAGVAYVSGDTVQVAVDLDAHKIWFGKNNTWSNSGNPASGTNPNVDGIAATTFYISAVFFNTPNVGPVTNAAGLTIPTGFQWWA